MHINQSFAAYKLQDEHYKEGNNCLVNEDSGIPWIGFVPINENKFVAIDCMAGFAAAFVPE